MGKKKRMVLLVLGIIILGIAIYQYPLQKAFAQKAFEAYIDKQGIDPDNIAIKKLVKDWKQGGYLIVVTFNGAGDETRTRSRHPANGKAIRRNPAFTSGFNALRAGRGSEFNLPATFQKEKPPLWGGFFFGAGDEARTRYLDLGKVALYQMSYARKRHHYCGTDGASGRGRTGDTRIFSPLLYQLSYRGKWRPRRGSNPRPPA